MSGECQFNVKSMSIRFRTQVNHLSRAIETFQRSGLVTINQSGFLVITNWSKRQFKSDRVTDRVNKFREVNKKRNVSETELKRPQSTDTDTDTDTTPLPPPKKGESFSVSFLSFWKSYPKKVGKDAAWRAWKKRKDIPVDSVFSIIERQKQTDQWKRGFIPNPATWINQGRWEDEIESMNGGGNNGTGRNTSSGSGVQKTPPEYIPDAPISEEQRIKNLQRIKQFTG